MAALIPIALHELNNATQFIGMLHSVVAEGPQDGVLERSASDLGQTAESVEDLGLLMAILSATAGSDLLLERKSARGVSIVLAAVKKLIRKGGRDLEVNIPLESVRSLGEGRGWELPWAIGASAWLASRELPMGETLQLNFEASSWGSGQGVSGALQEHISEVERVMPGASGGTEGAAWSLTAPPGWLPSAP